MKNIFIGFVIGAGKIIPGVSGSVLAIAFGVYEKLLYLVSNIRKINFSSFIYLLLLCIGIFGGILIFSGVIEYFLSRFYLATMLLFVGLIIGGVPEVCKQFDISKFKWRYLFIFVLSLFFPYLISLFFSFFSLFFGDGPFTFCLLGFIESFSSVVPGISGTAIYISIGYYDVVLDFFNNIFDVSYLKFGFWFSIGILLGLFLIAKLILYCFDHYKSGTYFSIFGFLISSIFMMFFSSFSHGFDLFEFLIGIVLGGFGCLFMIKFNYAGTK